MEERREKLIQSINHLPEDKLALVEELLSKINNTNSASIDQIYKEACATMKHCKNWHSDNCFRQNTKSISL